MRTAKQIAASRANGQKSHGPRTAAGKAVSRFNALKHGIFAVSQLMFDETAEDLAELTAEYHERHSPSNPEERLLVETLIANEWRLRRMRRVEANLWESANFTCLANKMANDLPVPDHCTSGEAFLTDSPTFERLQRVVNSCEREYHRALKDLGARAHGIQIAHPESSGSFCTNSRGAPEPGAAGPAAVEHPPNSPVARAQCLRTPQPEEPKTTSESSSSFRTNALSTPGSITAGRAADRAPNPKAA
jgi:hypothetical protein